VRSDEHGSIEEREKQNTSYELEVQKKGFVKKKCQRTSI